MSVNAHTSSSPETTVPTGAAVWVEDWAAQGACRAGDPDTLFVQGAEQNRAKAVCMGCPVRTECLADALDNRVEFGVWGGMTERERRALLKKRPNVTSWRRLLEHARAEHLRATRAQADVERFAS
jgi:WhiB family redox-sensing transcriptional regulator